MKKGKFLLKSFGTRTVEGVIKKIEELIESNQCSEAFKLIVRLMQSRIKMTEDQFKSISSLLVSKKLKLESCDEEENR